jgi:hypothetical protein
MFVTVKVMFTGSPKVKVVFCSDMVNLIPSFTSSVVVTREVLAEDGFAIKLEAETVPSTKIIARTSSVCLVPLVIATPLSLLWRFECIRVRVLRATDNNERNVFFGLTEYGEKVWKAVRIGCSGLTESATINPRNE